MAPTLLDTDIVSHLVRLQPVALDWAKGYILEHGSLQFSIITYYESLSGLLYKDARQQSGQFEALVRLHRMLPLTIESVNYSARIEADLRQRGLSIGPTDIIDCGRGFSQWIGISHQ